MRGNFKINVPGKLGLFAGVTLKALFGHDFIHRVLVAGVQILLMLQLHLRTQVHQKLPREWVCYETKDRLL